MKDTAGGELGTTRGLDTGTGGGGYSVLTTHTTARWATTRTRSDASATETMSWMVIVCCPFFVSGKQTAMQTNPMLDPRVDRLYSTLRGRIDWTNLVPTCLELAQELEQMTELRGQERLDLLLKTLKHALHESKMSSDEKERILFTIDTVIPVAMQAAILASKHPIVNAALTGCWSWCTKEKPVYTNKT